MEETVLADSPCHKSARTHLTTQLMIYYETLEDFDDSRLQHLSNVTCSIFLVCGDEDPAEISEYLFGSQKAAQF